MKKSLITYAMVAAISLGFMGCSQDETAGDGTNANKQTITFVSGDETTPTTRTSMGVGSDYATAAKFPFYWEAGDAIWVNAKDKITGSNTGTASYALFTGSVTTSTTPYKIRYTGTGSYTSNNQRDATYSFTTTSNAKTLVIPPVQTITTWADGAATSRIGANGDCGTATATGSKSPYNFKLDHKAAYLILMPHWGTSGTNTTYKLKSVTVTVDYGNLSGRFKFNDNGIDYPITNTYGSLAIKITTGGSGGLILPTATDQTKSINIVMRPVTSTTPLFCIYEISDGTNTYYIEKIIEGKSFAANTVTPITADIKAGYDAAVNNPASKGGSYLNLITNKNPYFNSYEWDVPDGEEYTVSHEMEDDYNPIPKVAGDTPTAAESSQTWATHSNFSSSNLPTYNQISWYIKGGCYWDADKVWGPDPNQKGGMWLKKKAYLISSGVVKDEETFNTSQSGSTRNVPITTAPTSTELSSNWFFLPAAGSYHSQSNRGSQGGYWSSSPSLNNSCHLGFDKTSIYLDNSLRLCGYYLWSIQ